MTQDTDPTKTKAMSSQPAPADKTGPADGSRQFAQRDTLPSLIAWLSVCLLIAGWGPLVGAYLRGLWSSFGLLGLAAAVGLDIVARKRREQRRRELTDVNQELKTDLDSVKAEIQFQRQQLDAYMAEARTDVLTGLANRRAFNEEVNRRFAQFHRQGTPVSLVLVDVDHFKQFNDKHGHLAGDQLLRAVAHMLTHTVREMDIVARYGGEEFAVILPGTTLSAGGSAAERLRTSVAGHRFVFSGTPLHVTVSLGVAEAMPLEGAEGLIKRADEALYAAKEAGRNCSYGHTGETCQRVEEIPPGAAPRTATRRVCLAPYVDGRIVERDMFHDVNCQDLSAKGFCYLSPEEPDDEQVVVTMGDDGGRSSMSAHVESCLNIGTDEEPVYLVRCRLFASTDAEDSGMAVSRASSMVESADISP